MYGLPANPGDRFGVFNGDAKGTIDKINSQHVLYHFDHDMEVKHENSRTWFDSCTFPLPAKVVKETENV